MSPDTRQSLRTVWSLANPSGMQAARWGSPDTRQSLRTVWSLANPSGMQAAQSL